MNEVHIHVNNIKKAGLHQCLIPNKMLLVLCSEALPSVGAFFYRPVSSAARYANIY